MLQVAQTLMQNAKAVLLKGGHLLSDMAHDLLLTQEDLPAWFSAPKIQTKNTHGTGCTLSAAITAMLALGNDLFTSCQHAKHYLTQAISAASNMNIGHGAGPIHHFYHWWPVGDF